MILLPCYAIDEYAYLGMMLYASGLYKLFVYERFIMPLMVVHPN